MIYVRGGRSAAPCEQRSSLFSVASRQKSNPADESITEMNEDGSAMMHEARRLGSALGSWCALALSVRFRTAHAGRFIIKCGYVEASRVALWAANETFIQFRDNIITLDWFCGGRPAPVTLGSLGRKRCTCWPHLWESLTIYFFSPKDNSETREPLCTSSVGVNDPRRVRWLLETRRVSILQMISSALRIETL